MGTSRTILFAAAIAVAGSSLAAFPGCGVDGGTDAGGDADAVADADADAVADADADGDADGDSGFGAILGFAPAEYAEDLALVGSYALVACKTDGVVVFDISDATAPTAVTTIDVGGEAWDLVIDGERAYVAARTAGLVVLDVSNPASPSIAGTFTPLDGSGGAFGVDAVAVDGATVYVGGGNGADGFVAALDASDPADINQTAVSEAVTGEAATSLGAANGHIFFGGANGHLVVLDSILAVVGSYFNPGTAGHEPWGLGITVDSDRLFYSDWGAGLVLLDISTPSDPSEVDLYTTADGIYDSAIARNLVIAGTSHDRVAVVANSQGGLAVVDVTDTTLTELALLDIVPEGELADGPHGVAVDAARSLAVVADNMAQTITIVRIAD